MKTDPVQQAGRKSPAIEPQTFEDFTRQSRPLVPIIPLATKESVATVTPSEATRLELAVTGPMSEMLHDEDADLIVQWVALGATEDQYNDTIAPIVEEHCVICHSGDNPHIRDLMSYSKIMSNVQLDTGMAMSALVRISHIHLFGMTFIFFIVAEIFSRTAWRRNWIKWTVITIPFVAIVSDISSWYLTKIHDGFAWIILVSGALMGLSFAIQWGVSMYQMWLYKPSGKPIKVR